MTTYEKDVLLGKGVYGRVYSLKDNRKLVKKVSDIDDDNLPSIIRELACLKFLRNIDNVLQVEHFHFGEKLVHKKIVNTCSVYLEKYPHTLTDIETATYNDVVDIIYQLLTGLQELHKRNLIHGDIKPDNILYRKEDDRYNVVLADFGSARFCTDYEIGKTKMDYNMQTLWWRSPEVTLNSISHKYFTRSSGFYNIKIDIWSIGVIFLTFLIGDIPFRADNARHHYNKIKNICDHIPSALIGKHRRLLEGMLEFKQSERLSVEDALSSKVFRAVKEKKSHLTQPQPQDALDVDIIDISDESDSTDDNLDTSLDETTNNQEKEHLVIDKHLSDTRKDYYIREDAVIDPDYINHMENIGCSERKQIVEFIEKICDHFRLVTHSLYLAVHLLDLFSMKNKNLERDDYHGYAICCLYLADSIHGNWHMLLKDMSNYCKKFYKERDFIEFIKEIVTSLDGNLIYATELTYLNELANQHDVKYIILQKAEKRMRASLLYLETRQFTNRQIALAAINTVEADAKCDEEVLNYLASISPYIGLI